MYDILIKNSTIVDGKGSAAYKSDIAVKDGYITEINTNINKDAESKRVINAEGKYLCPGFIDAHSHADLNLIEDGYPENKIFQGVTTEIAGHCGNSLFPINSLIIPAFNSVLQSSGINIDVEWSSAQEFFNKLESNGIGLNYIPITGHGTLRMNAVGLKMKKADDNEINLMKNYLAKTFEEGSWGLSVGLEYLPGCFADEKELKELAKVVAKYNRVFTVHLRNQDKNLLSSIEEIVKISRSTGVKTVISHLKASGNENWGKVAQAIDMIDKAKEDGCNITFDFYPYDASYSFLSIFLPAWVKEGGDKKIVEKLSDNSTKLEIINHFKSQDYTWENVIISKSTSNEMKKFEGKSIMNVSIELGLSQEETVFYLLQNDPAIYALYISMGEEDISNLAKTSYSIIGSDSFVIPKNAKGNHCHPRNYGTFPKFIKKYVKEEKTLSIEKAIAKMTGLTAEFYGIDKRGVIANGNYADFVILDLNKLHDKSSYEKPTEKPEGIEYVIINGEIQLENGLIKNKKIGKIIRK